MTHDRRKQGEILNGSRRQVVDRIAGILREGEPTVFCRMAACQHGLRNAFINCGHGWHVSHWAAERVVLGALTQIGAQFPAWREGQPEFTQEGHIPVERTRCVRCGGRLPEGHHRYCSRICLVAAHNAKARILDRENRQAHYRAWLEGWRAAQPKQVCPSCRVRFKPRWPRQVFCSNACVGVANRAPPG